MYFVIKDIPKNETNKVAHVQCTDEETAKKYCPTRWAAMQNWFKESLKVNEKNLSYRTSCSNSVCQLSILS